MYARIKYTVKTSGSVMYNEKKIVEKKAECIWAENFLKGHLELSLSEKNERFYQRGSLSERWPKAGIHISLNFGAQESIDNQRMAEVSRAYMRGLGLADQPYLVYRHNDASHVHCHIVAPRVDEEGKRILIFLDWVRSRSVCQELEKKFQLEHHLKPEIPQQKQFEVQTAQRIQYGEKPLRRAMSDVLNTVIEHYNYTNVEELDAILRQFNVTVHLGKEGSYLREKEGVLFKAIDDDGKFIGPPIKASMFYLKPTLPHLKKKFIQNLVHRERLTLSVMVVIGGLDNCHSDWEEFVQKMRQRDIQVSLVKEKEGQKDVLYFVDHVRRCAYSTNTLSAGVRQQILRIRCPEEYELELKQSQRHQLRLGM